MSGAPSYAGPDAAPRRARWLVAVVAISALLLLAVAVAWFERRDLARGYADDLLRAKGVPARYRIAELGLGTQRLTGVVLGDPAHPDLTADWIETRTELGLDGPRVVAVRAGRVRLRGRIVDGRMSLGALDRLLPASGGKPFALPDLALDIADGRLRLDTPAGPVGVRLGGSGGLQGGFAGVVAVAAPRIAAGGCVLGRASAYGRIAIARGGAPRFIGPVRVAEGRCGTIAARGLVADLDTLLGAALDRWRGQVRLSLAAVERPGFAASRSGGTIGFAGDARRTTGRIDLAGGAVRRAGTALDRWRLAGAYRIDGGAVVRTSFAGRGDLSGLRAPPAWRAAAASLGGVGAGTPIGPLARRLGAGLSAAAVASTLRADLRASADTGGRWAGRVTRADAQFGPGGRAGSARFDDGKGIALGPGGVTVDGTLTWTGGALPQGRVVLAQAATGAPLTGIATLASYAAGGATLALSPVRFTATPAGRTGFATRLTLSGPLGDGRVERATLALTGGWDGRGRLLVNPGCAPAGFDRLRVAGLALAPARFALCPAGPALFALADGRTEGGARLANVRVTGTLGGSPLGLAVAGGEWRFADGALSASGLAARLGQPGRRSWLDIASLTGRIAGGGVAGRYAGAGGQIGAVPLIVSDAAGDWRLAGGVLTLGGALTVSDAAAARRFEPLPARDVALRMASGVVTATGRLTAPGGPATVADVAIRHRLSDGSGHADLTVPGIAFSPTLQPTALTPLTLGVVADVRGTVAGRGRIDWGGVGVRSTGSFATDGLDLAAAFGPVTGLRGRLAFTDLLALESAPDQVATIASVNPGVAVEDGTIRYQLLPNLRVRIAGGRWPFAGGALTLDPTLLDFAQGAERRLTFRVEGMDAALFLQRFDYKNLAATGVFDGTLPMVFDAGGGRIEGGRLTARSGGTLAYVGEVSQENLGTWGNLAFQALKSLRYRALDIALGGPLAGEMVTEARFGGIAQGAGASTNFITRRIAKLPFVFNVRISAPFRALIDTARSFWDPNLLVRRNLPSLIEAEKRAVQPPASAPVPPQR